MVSQLKQNPSLLGVGLRPAHFSHWQKAPFTPPVFEILADHLIHQEGGPIWEQIESLSTSKLCLLHSVGLNIGSFEPLDLGYIKQLRLIADRLHIQKISDHLCFTRADGLSSFELLPIAKTKTMLQHIKDRVLKVQDLLQRPLVLENISQYIDYAMPQMSEGEFLNELAEQTGCGILLDLNNIEVNAFNFKKDFHEILKTFDLKHVSWIHIAGHTKYDDYYFDTHDQKASSLVIKALGSIWGQIHVPAILEWDEESTPFEEVFEEFTRIAYHLEQTSLQALQNQQKNLVQSFWQKDALNPKDWIYQERLSIYRTSLAARSINGVRDSVFLPLQETFGKDPVDHMLFLFFQSHPFKHADLIENIKGFPFFVADHWQGSGADAFAALASACLCYWDLIHGKDPEPLVLSQGDLTSAFLWPISCLVDFKEHVDLASLWLEKNANVYKKASSILFLKTDSSSCIAIQVDECIYGFVKLLIQEKSLEEAIDFLEEGSEEAATAFIKQALFYQKA